MSKLDGEIKSENPIAEESESRNGESVSHEAETGKKNDSPAASRGKGGPKLGERAKLAIILTSVLLIIALIVGIMVSSFGDRYYDEDEVIAVAKELLPTAGKLYSIYYGNGIAFMSSGYSDGDYREADPFHLATLGIENIQDLRDLSFATFTKKYCNNIFASYLESYEEDGVVYNWARYVQVYDVIDATIPAYILVYSKHKGVFEDRMTYDLSSIKAVKSKGDYVYMTVDVTVESIEGKTQTATIEFTLFEEPTGWRIASPAFANYNEYRDHELLQ